MSPVIIAAIISSISTLIATILTVSASTRKKKQLLDPRVYKNELLLSYLRSIVESYLKLLEQNHSNNIVNQVRESALGLLVNDLKEIAGTRVIPVGEYNRMEIMKEELRKQRRGDIVWAVNNEDISWWIGPGGEDYFTCNAEATSRQVEIRRIFIIDKNDNSIDKYKIISVIETQVEREIQVFVISKEKAISVPGFSSESQKSWFVTKDICGWSHQDATHNIIESFVTDNQKRMSGLKNLAVRLQNSSELANEYLMRVKSNENI